MYYLERVPAPPLNRAVVSLWYTRAPQVPYSLQRILPTGRTQIIINLARDFLWECSERGREGCSSASLIVGARSRYEIVDTSDLAELAGIVFHPGSFPSFVSCPADVFSNLSTSLEEVWGSKAALLRERLLEISDAGAKLDVLESFLLQEMRPPDPRGNLVDYAIRQFARRSGSILSVAQVASDTGLSVRHFSQIFREQVGIAPKAWCRIQRFQQAVQQLHQGAEVGWAELSLDCGYYDQSHFANEFRAFSGVDASTYTAGRRPWANHLAL